MLEPENEQKISFWIKKLHHASVFEQDFSVSQLLKQKLYKVSGFESKKERVSFWSEIWTRRQILN